MGSSEQPGARAPHTPFRGTPWLVTAAAVAAVIGAGALIAPEEVSARPSQDARPASAPDPAAAVYPLDCAGAPVVVAKTAYGDLDRDGRTDAVAAVHCKAGNGTPPHEVYVLSHGGAGSGARPRVVARLLGAAERMTVDRIAVRDSGVTVRMLGYSSRDVPSCCPDVRATRNWGWKSGRFVLEAAPLSANT